MKILLPFLVLLCCAQAIHTPVGAQTTDKTLLWRISGKSMPRPSYLYGTIHLKTRKLFNFPDSLYTALDNTEVFALEINPDSLNGSLTEYLEKVINKKDTKKKKKEKKLSEILTPSELRTLRENLPKDSDIDPEELTVKQAIFMKDRLARHRERKDDMATFVDAYLYRIARDKGKYIAGLERMEDQLSLLEDTVLDHVDPKKVASYFDGSMSVEDRMVQLYMDKDLDGLQRVTGMMSEEQEDAMLNVRNKTMLRSMDSILQHHSLFAAVGALHLPGGKGLISLLRQKGYKVDPVFCNTSTNGAEYKFSSNKPQWFTVTSEKDGYSIDMPGQPSDLSVGGGIVSMKMYYDIGASKYYLVGHIVRADTSTSLDEVADLMAKNAAATEKPESRSVTSGGLNGREYFFTGKGNLYYHMQILVSGTDAYMLVVYAQAPVVRKVDEFFGSFKVMPKSGVAVVSRTFDDILLSASLPDIKADRTVEYDADTSNKQTMYTIGDASLGVYCFIVCNETGRGYNFSNDTVFTHNMRTRLASQHLDARFAKTRSGEYDAYDVETGVFGNTKIKSKLVFCGNRQYSLLVQFMDNEKGNAAADQFLQSVRVIPATVMPLQERRPIGETFSVMVPGPFVTDTTEGHNVDTSQPYTAVYRSFDTASLLTYEVRAKRLSEYFWKTDDTLMLKTWLDRFVPATDSTPTYSYYSKDGMLYGELVAYKRFTRKIHRIRALSDGRMRYMQDLTYPASLKDDPRISSFYSSFRVLRKESQPLLSSPTKLLADLHSADSATCAHAKKAIDEVLFLKKDIPLLINEVQRPFPDDDDRLIFSRAGNKLFGVLKPYAADMTMEQLNELYRAPLIAKRKLQFDVLIMMLELEDTTAAANAIKELLISSPPVSGGHYMLLYKLRAYPGLVRGFYPKLLERCADTSIGSLVCALAKRLLDSANITRQEMKSYSPVIVEKSRQQRLSGGPLPGRDLFELLARIGTDETWNELEQYQYVHNKHIRYTAVSLMIDSMHMPAAAVLDSIAADEDYRLTLHRALTRKELTSLFPKRYLKQELFAKCYLADYDYEGDYENYSLIGPRTEMYKGKKQTFYLYKAMNANDSAYYLGVVGPFSTSSSVATLDDEEDVTGFHSDPLNMAKVGEQLKVYLISRKISRSRAAERSEEED